MSFSHLLVPLDGSRMAEAVLPAANEIAARFGAWVTLVHVIEKNAPAAVHGDSHLREPEEAERYLRELTATRLSGVARVEQHVHTSEVKDVAKSIAEHVVEFSSDLIVMCTHGKAGPRELLFGSIAQQVIALGATPVLLLQPDSESPAPYRCRRILAPLDGEPEHALGLPIVAEYARAFGASINLVSVVETFGTLSGQDSVTSKLLPGTTSRMLDLSVAMVGEYLEEQAEQLRTGNLLVDTEVLRGDPSKMIANAALRIEADLLALGTHQRIGANAFWSGSVAARVCRACHAPLLLIPLPTASA